MTKIIELCVKFTFVIGVALILYSLFKKTNYNEWFSIALCVCTAHWIWDTVEKIIKEVQDE